MSAAPPPPSPQSSTFPSVLPPMRQAGDVDHKTLYPLFHHACIADISSSSSEVGGGGKEKRFQGYRSYPPLSFPRGDGERRRRRRRRRRRKERSFSSRRLEGGGGGSISATGGGGRKEGGFGHRDNLCKSRRDEGGEEALSFYCEQCCLIGQF